VVEHIEKKMRLYEQGVTNRIQLANEGTPEEQERHKAFLNQEADVNGQFDFQDELNYFEEIFDNIRETYDYPDFPSCEPLGERQAPQQMYRFQRDGFIDKTLDEETIKRYLRFWAEIPEVMNDYIVISKIP